MINSKSITPVVKDSSTYAAKSISHPTNLANRMFPFRKHDDKRSTADSNGQIMCTILCCHLFVEDNTFIYIEIEFHLLSFSLFKRVYIFIYIMILS